MNFLNKRELLIIRSFIIYNQKTNDSFVILNINSKKKYILYFDWYNKERTIQIPLDTNDNYFIY